MVPLLALMMFSQQPSITVMEGIASYYTVESSSTLTASGETFTDDGMTCAMRNGKFGTYYRVTDMETGRSVVVKLNDRGPYIDGRVIDLSEGAMKRLDPHLKNGILDVRIEQVSKRVAEAHYRS